MAEQTIDEVLERLRKLRACGRRMEVEVGVRLMALRDSGDITNAQCDYVMGINLIEGPETTSQSSPLDSSSPTKDSGNDQEITADILEHIKHANLR